MAATQDNKPLTNEMRHEVFNRRYADLMEAARGIENHDRKEPEAGSEEAIHLAQEAYDLMNEVPPASNRYKYLRSVFEYHGGYKVVKIHPADNSKEAKKIALREPKMPVGHHATRGKTFKATPRQLATGKVAALEAQVAAFAANVAWHEGLVSAAKAELAGAEAKLIEARKAVKGTRKAETAPSAAPKAPAKATPTPKGELSEAMKVVLKVIGGNYKTTMTLTPQQFSAARMHLAMRKLIAKKPDTKDLYMLTPAGKTALKGL